MNFDEAMKLKTGMVVFSNDRQKLLISSIDINFSFTDSGEEIKNCFVNVIDSKLNKKKLSYEDIFFDTDFLSDEEKIFVKWVEENKNFINKNKDLLHIISYCFFEGFSQGYKYKIKYKIEELMQK